MSNDTISCSAARQNLPKLVKGVVNDSTHVVIKSRVGNVILLSFEDYSSLRETAELMRSPANVRRIMEARTAVDEGKAFEVSQEEIEKSFQ